MIFTYYTMHHLPAWVALKWINIHKCLSLTLDIEKYICVTTLNFECFNTSMNVLIFPRKFIKLDIIRTLQMVFSLHKD